MKRFISLIFIFFIFSMHGSLLHNNNRSITIAIFAKRNSNLLPLFLNCIENQTWPKDKTHIYIQLNENKSACNLLQEWVACIAHKYLSVQIVTHHEGLEKHAEDSYSFFSIFGKQHEAACAWALSNDSHYFECDTDFFIIPSTLYDLYDLQLPIVGPLLLSNNSYSNFHAAIDERGYYKDSNVYLPLLNQELKGIFQVPVINGCYLIHHNYLPYIKYWDESGRYNYVIFSENARNKNIAQYLDNRLIYGRISFCKDLQILFKEAWIDELIRNRSVCKLVNETLSVLNSADTTSCEYIFTRNFQKRYGIDIGSSKEATVNYRRFLENFLKTHNIQSVIDLGCGDWEFSKLIDWSGIDYIGVDVIQPLIEQNKIFEKDNIHFMYADALTQDLPKADLLLCKDVLQHLTNDDIKQLLQKFTQYKYCLITNGLNTFTLSSDNQDISRGDYRPLDLIKSPFNIRAKKVLTYNNGQFLMQTLLLQND